MKVPHHEVIVVGLGAMGSATLRELAARGLKVLGADRFDPPHALGSSHGRTRIIREAYFEHPSYVPLVRRAYELWGKLEEVTGETLLQTTGGLMIGPRDGVLVTGALRSARTHGLKHELLDAVEVRERFPGLTLAAETVAVWEARAGVLFPEKAIAANLDLAGRAGATLRRNDPVISWDADADGVRVRFAGGECSATRLVLSAGPWLRGLASDLRVPLAIERQFLTWFAPNPPGEMQLGRCPIYIWEYEAGKFFYGFPDLGEGVKIGIHHQGEFTSPESVTREVAESEIASVRRLLTGRIPSIADGQVLETAVCLYTNTPDENFVLDFHPAHSRVLVVSPCSGHGFKFAPVIGEIAADLVEGKRPTFDLNLFKIDRLARR